MRIRRILYVVAILISTLCVSCDKKKNLKSTEDVAFSTCRVYEFADTNDYYIYKYMDTPVYCENKKTHKKEDVYKDIYMDADGVQTQADNIITSGNNVYYMTEKNQKNIIFKVNMNNGENEIIYETEERLSNTKFLGKTIWTDSKNFDDYNDDQIQNFFIHDGQLILIRGNRVDCVEGEKEKTLFYEETTMVSYCNDVMYYSNEFDEIYKYDFDNGKVTKLDGLFCGYIEALNDGFVYRDDLNNSDFYYDDGKKNFVCSGETVDVVACDKKGYIYYIQDGKAMRYDCKNKTTKKLCDVKNDESNGWLSDLYITNDNELFVKVSSDKMERFKKIDY